jgi:hypothetical protein
MKVKIECSGCHKELPIPEIWQRELEDPKKAKMDIEIISYDTCNACFVALRQEELGVEGVEFILNYRK